jgi:hypothetical protein
MSKILVNNKVTKNENIIISQNIYNSLYIVMNKVY